MLKKCTLLVCGLWIILNTFYVSVYGNVREIRSPQTNWWQQAQFQQQPPNGNVLEGKSQSNQQGNNDLIFIFNKENDSLVEVRGNWPSRSGEVVNTAPQVLYASNENSNNVPPRPAVSPQEERPIQQPSLEAWRPPSPEGWQSRPPTPEGWQSRPPAPGGWQSRSPSGGAPLQGSPSPQQGSPSPYDKRSAQYPGPPYRGAWNNSPPNSRQYSGYSRGFYGGPPPYRWGWSPGPPAYRGPPSYYRGPPLDYRGSSPGHRGPPGDRWQHPYHKWQSQGHRGPPPDRQETLSDEQDPSQDNRYFSDDNGTNKQSPSSTANEEQIDIRYGSNRAPDTSVKTQTIDIDTLNKIFGSLSNTNLKLTTDGDALVNNNNWSTTEKVPPRIFQVAPVTPDE